MHELFYMIDSNRERHEEMYIESDLGEAFLESSCGLFFFFQLASWPACLPWKSSQQHRVPRVWRQIQAEHIHVVDHAELQDGQNAVWNVRTAAEIVYNKIVEINASRVCSDPRRVPR